ncbi:hypothetical protein [Paremcibacter congregatus]|uniref:hypothetical protein n=1 Tax=Paremcibacter congregatus TaxID=2043170 RepID=UPI003A9017E3|tara:strand:+ start:256 stop:765 length:510 start_codon:yes stop_codon:yes gene_type:complete
MKKIVEIAIFIGFSFGFAGFSFADQAPHEFLTCGAIKPDKQRLACFDAALERATPDKLARKKDEKRQKIDDFGKAQLRSSPVKAVAEKQDADQKKDLNSIKLKVSRFSYTNSKKFVLFMANGQIWKQKSGGRIRLPQGEFEVEIKKGVLSGFNAILPTHRSIVKVHRVK